MKRLMIIGLVVVACAMGSSPGHAAYKGRVVDADTKEPIEGAVVFMKWVQAHAWGHSYLDAYETLTDKEGRFSLPRYWSINLWKMAWADNRLTIFKSGYGPIDGGSWRYLLKIEWGAPKGKFIWKTESGKPVILLKKLDSIEEMRQSHRKFDVDPGGRVPEEKWKLLRGEMKKELGLLDIPYPKDW